MDATLVSQSDLNAELSTATLQGTLCFTGVQIGTGVPYAGAYSVTPKVSSGVVLPTKDRLLGQDITVNPIPKYEVANNSGGQTLIISEDYEP